MHDLPRPAGASSRVLAALAVLVAALGAAFVVGPPRLAATGPAAELTDQQHLIAAFRPALIEYWRTGDQNYTPALQHVVDYWFRFHLIKGGIAGLLMIVLVTLAVLLWRTVLRSEHLRTGRKAALVSAGIAAPLLALAALAITMANIQGAAAPLSSLLPLMTGDSETAMVDMLSQAKRQLTGTHRTSGYTPRALDAMVSDFGLYHAVLAFVAAAVVVALLFLSTLFWRSLARTDKANRRTRRVLASFAVFSTLSCLMVAVVFVANTGTAMDPAPALLAFFNGGF